MYHQTYGIPNPSLRQVRSGGARPGVSVFDRTISDLTKIDPSRFTNWAKAAAAAQHRKIVNYN